MSYICWNVVFVVYSMFVAHERRLGLGLTIIRCVVLSLVWVSQFPRQNSSDISLEKDTMGFCRILVLKS